MDAALKSYLALLQRLPNQLQVALGIALDELSHSIMRGQTERLSAEVVSIGQEPQTRADLRRLNIILKSQRKSVERWHLWYLRNSAHRLASQTVKESEALQGAREMLEDNSLSDAHPQLTGHIQEVLGIMCLREIQALGHCFSELREDGRFELRDPITLQSLSKSLSFALVPLWPSTLPPAVAVYLAYLYGEALVPTLQEARHLVEREHQQLQRDHKRLSAHTDSGFIVTVPGLMPTQNAAGASASG